QEAHQQEEQPQAEIAGDGVQARTTETLRSMLTHRFWSVEHRFDYIAGGWRDGGAATAGEAGDPEDLVVGHEDRDGGALLAGDLGVDEDVLELPRAALQEVDAVAGTGRADGESCGQG